MIDARFVDIDFSPALRQIFLAGVDRSIVASAEMAGVLDSDRMYGIHNVSWKLVVSPSLPRGRFVQNVVWFPVEAREVGVDEGIRKGRADCLTVRCNGIAVSPHSNRLQGYLVVHLALVMLRPWHRSLQCCIPVRNLFSSRLCSVWNRAGAVVDCQFIGVWLVLVF